MNKTVLSRRSQRGDSSTPGSRGALFVLLTLGVLLSLLSVGVDAQGGSIFMKNGYIIQGQIVERSDGHLAIRPAKNEGVIAETTAVFKC